MIRCFSLENQVFKSKYKNFYYFVTGTGLQPEYYLNLLTFCKMIRNSYFTCFVPPKSQGFTGFNMMRHPKHIQGFSWISTLQRRLYGISIFSTFLVNSYRQTFSKKSLELWIKTIWKTIRQRNIIHPSYRYFRVLDHR